MISSSYRVDSRLRHAAAANWVLTTIIVVAAFSTRCFDCKPTFYGDPKISPTREYVSASYSYDCGPVPPFNSHVGLRRAAEASYHDVVSVLDAPFDAHAEWRGAKKLLVTFDCPDDPQAGCAPPTKRYWSVRPSKQWAGVEISYAVGPRLKALLTPESLARLPAE